MWWIAREKNPKEIQKLPLPLSFCESVLISRPNKYLAHTRVVQEGEQCFAVSRGGGLVVHHGNLDPLWVSSDTQTDERDLDDGQQELETQRAASTDETMAVRNAAPEHHLQIFYMLVLQCYLMLILTYPGILFIRTMVLIMRAAMFLHLGSICLARTFQSAVQSQ